MSKTRNSVSLGAVCAGLLVVSFVEVAAACGVIVSAQETPRQTEQQKQAREALDQGIQDFKDGQHDEAIANFQLAKQLDPKLLNARLYLATSYAALCHPGVEDEENAQRGHEAIKEFREVLNIEPQNISAIDGLGSILFQMAGQPFDPDLFEESKSYHRKHIRLRPEDPEPYYWIGVIEWTLAFRANGQLRAKFNLSVHGKQLSDAKPLPPDVQEEYAREYGPAIDEGIDSLKHAISIRPDYEDAMAYLNLLYRRKADTVANSDDRQKLIQMADDLVDKVKESKENRTEPPPQ